MAQTLLEVRDLSKTFRSHWTFREIPAISGISFEVFEGESFGFLGHNGAGKTTTIKCLLGLIRSGTGSIVYGGESLRSPEQRASIGYLPELPYFYDHLTVEETLGFLATLYGPQPGLATIRERRHRVRDVIDFVGLTPKLGDRVRSLSKGLQQRLGLAQAIIHRPRLLLLDEPFSGLDPIGRYEFRQILAAMREQGTAMMISSHVLSDIETLCDRVTIMSRGKIAARFAMNEMAALYGEVYHLSCSAPNMGNITPLSERYPIASHMVTSSGVQVEFTFSSREHSEHALRIALSSGIDVREYRASVPSLESIFVQVVGKQSE